MAIASEISQLFNSPQVVPLKQWVDKTTEQYPYFALPLLLLVKRDSGNHDEALQRLAVMSPDRRDLAIATGNAPQAFAHFYPTEPQPSPPDTDTAIDRFIATYAQGSNQRELDALSKAIFNPTPDYADILAAQQQPGEDNNNGHSHEDELINSFIEHSRKQEQDALELQPAIAEQHVPAEQAKQAAHDAIEQSTLQDDSMLSESLAKMYIARGKYSKALEIIESINLNFPEKSIYFADQIRFLRKLVLNETLKNKL